MNEPPLPAPPPRPQPQKLRAARPWGVPFAVVAILGLVGIAVLALLPSRLVADKAVLDAEGNAVEVEAPYALVPAAAQPVADRVSYGDGLGDDISVDTDPDGRVYFVTVSEPPQSVLGYMASAAVGPTWLRGLVGDPEPEIDFTTRAEKYGTQTPSQQREASLQMMYGSSQIAQYVALTRSGYDATINDGAVQVDQFLCMSGSGTRCDEYVPVADQLERGDILVSVDGVETPTLDELTVALADNEPGDQVEVTVERQGVGTDEPSTVTVDVTLLSASEDPADEPNYQRPIIGFVPFDTRTVELPFEIQIDTGQIGGPSVGLAFTLTLIDELTDGDLLGGINVAVTGTMSLDGTVGAIGGLAQKVSTVRQAGIDYFLVPATQTDLDRAREIAGDDVELIPVANVDEAFAALQELGGDPLAD